MQKFAVVFVRHFPIGKKLLAETAAKGIKLRDYMMRYINLRNVFIELYKAKRGIFNLQKLEKRLKRKDIVGAMHHLDDMVDLLNLKMKKRFVNNLDVVENLVKVCQKLGEKGVAFTNRMLFRTERDYTVSKKEASAPAPAQGTK